MTSFTTLNENATSVGRAPHCPGFHRSGPTLHRGTQARYPGAPWVGFRDVLGSCAEPGDLFGGAGGGGHLRRPLPCDGTCRGGGAPYPASEYRLSPRLPIIMLFYREGAPSWVPLRYGGVGAVTAEPGNSFLTKELPHRGRWLASHALASPGSPSSRLTYH